MSEPAINMLDRLTDADSVDLETAANFNVVLIQKMYNLWFWCIEYVSVFFLFGGGQREPILRYSVLLISTKSSRYCINFI